MQDLNSKLAEYPDPFWRRFKVMQADLDGFCHVNNAIYLNWLDATFWEHTRAAGQSEQACIDQNRSMAAIPHEIDYLSSAFLDDDVVVFNQIALNDGKPRASRRFQVVRLGNRKTVLCARSSYECTILTTGAPPACQKFPEPPMA
ncbi:acyl-CoA thioesterase [Ruegeria hyattellae]|uniref:acyl-CoA thioesterase n=1 Tax=Ruegeria hyattellae TaxID=3233337 RepID=UPI00355C12C3